MTDRNVEIIYDKENNPVVIIKDKRFRGTTKEDWNRVEDYLKGYVATCYEIIETKEPVYIGKEFPTEYAGSESRIALKGARKKAKAEAAQGIPELIKIARNPRWEENREHSEDGYKYLHDITTIKKETSSPLEQ